MKSESANQPNLIEPITVKVIQNIIIVTIIIIIVIIRWRQQLGS